MIQNSIGSHVRKRLYITKESGEDIDILQDGNISCAYFVSSLLKQFAYCGTSFANVLSLKKHLLEYGRVQLEQNITPDNILPGSVIIWEEKAWTKKKDIYGNTVTWHYHIGFYIGNWQAISNMSDGFVANDLQARTPQIHHYTYNNTRPIQSILSFPFFMNLSEHFSQKRYTLYIHKQLEIPFIGQTRKCLDEYGFVWENLDRALGNKEDMEFGRMCGVACITMAYRYLSWKDDKSLYDTIQFRDKEHEKWVYRDKENGRYHDGLLAISKERWLSWIRWNLDLDNIIWFKELLADCIDAKKVLICSVSPWYNVEKRWGHLVIIKGYNRNGYSEELIISDPLDPKASEWFPGAPINIRLSDFMDCWSGKYLVIKK